MSRASERCLIQRRHQRRRRHPPLHQPRFVGLALAFLCSNLVAAQLLHEAGHWAVVTVAGRQPVWGPTGLVQLWDRAPTDPSRWVPTTSPDGASGWLRLASAIGGDVEWVLFLLAGPLAQLLAVAVGLAVVARARSAVARTLALIVASTNAFALTFYEIVSSLRGGGGDETLLSGYLGIGWLPIAVMLGGAAALGLLLCLRRLELASVRWRWRWVGAMALGTLPIGPLLALAQRLVVDGVDAGNPLFVPVVGFSLPVVVVALAALVGLGLLARQWRGAGLADR